MITDVLSKARADIIVILDDPDTPMRPEDYFRTETIVGLLAELIADTSCPSHLTMAERAEYREHATENDDDYFEPDWEEASAVRSAKFHEAMEGSGWRFGEGQSEERRAQYEKAFIAKLGAEA